MQTLYAIIQLRSNMQLENGSLHYNHDLEAKLVQVMNTKLFHVTFYVYGTPRVPKAFHTLITCKP